MSFRKDAIYFLQGKLSLAARKQRPCFRLKLRNQISFVKAASWDADGGAGSGDAGGLRNWAALLALCSVIAAFGEDVNLLAF